MIKTFTDTLEALAYWLKHHGVLRYDGSTGVWSIRVADSKEQDTN